MHAVKFRDRESGSYNDLSKSYHLILFNTGQSWNTVEFILSTIVFNCYDLDNIGNVLNSTVNQM